MARQARARFLADRILPVTATRTTRMEQGINNKFVIDPLDGGIFLVERESGMLVCQVQQLTM